MKINNYNDLEYAADKRLAVYTPNGRVFSKPKPAAFVMNMDVRSINNAINSGLYIYVKKNAQLIFFEGKLGFLMCSRHVPGLTDTFENDKIGYQNFLKHGGWHLIGGGMSKETMKAICRQFNGIWEDREFPF